MSGQLGESAFTRRLSAAIEAERDEMIAFGGDYPEHAVLTGWALVAEWAGDDGQAWLTQTQPAGQAYWRTLGMLDAAVRGVQPRGRD